MERSPYIRFEDSYITFAVPYTRRAVPDGLESGLRIQVVRSPCIRSVVSYGAECGLLVWLARIPCIWSAPSVYKKQESVCTL